MVQFTLLSWFTWLPEHDTIMTKRTFMNGTFFELKKDLSILGTPSVLTVWLVLRANGLTNTVHCIRKNMIHLLSLYIPLTNHVQGLYESYGPSFFLFINHQEKTRIHNIHYGPKKGG